MCVNYGEGKPYQPGFNWCTHSRTDCCILRDEACGSEEQHGYGLVWLNGPCARKQRHNYFTDLRSVGGGERKLCDAGSRNGEELTNPGSQYAASCHGARHS